MNTLIPLPFAPKLPTTSEVDHNLMPSNASPSAKHLLAAGLLTLILPINHANAEIAQFRQGENNYYGASDDYIVKRYPYRTFGSTTTLKALGMNTLALLKWDVQTIPSIALVDDVNIAIRVSNSSKERFNIYAMTKAWRGSDATWANLQPNLQGSPVLGTLQAHTTGNYSIVLNPEGKSLVQSWIQGSPNYGLVIASDGAGLDTLVFSSSDAKKIAVRPKLEISYSINNISPPLPTTVPSPTPTPISGGGSSTPTPTPKTTPLASITPTPVPSNAKNVIDVMVLYSTQNQTAEAARQRINFLITLSNQTYVDSFIDLQIRLVHTEPTSYSDTISMSTALDDLTAGNGAFSTVAATRAKYGADLVNLLRPYSNKYHADTCGIAWLGMDYGAAASANDGYSVVGDGTDKATGYYCDDVTFAHELGHNMGLEHERENSSGSKPVFPYAYAWGINGTFGTVMGYDSPTLNYFSTPLLPTQCKGTPCGYSKSDATRGSDQSAVVNYTAPFISNFQPTLTSTPVLQ